MANEVKYGKGSKDRVKKLKKYRDNYDEIKGFSHKNKWN